MFLSVLFKRSNNSPFRYVLRARSRHLSRKGQSRKDYESDEDVLSGFYAVDGTLPNQGHLNGEFVYGEVVDHAVDVQTLEDGDTIDVPYEITVECSFRDFWQSAFHSNDRINTSTPFARALGLQDAALPFSLLLFLTGAMTHADAAQVQLGYRNAVYHWPAFARDTFTRSFVLKERRQINKEPQTHEASLSDSPACVERDPTVPNALQGPIKDSLGDRSTNMDIAPWIYTFDCVLRNQRGKVVFTAEKLMLFNVDKIQKQTYRVQQGREKSKGSLRPVMRKSSDLEKHLIKSAINRLSNYTTGAIRKERESICLLYFLWQTNSLK